MYTIVDEEIDEAGKCRIRISIRGCTAMFKYDERPTLDQLAKDAARYEELSYPPEPVEVSDGPSDSG